MSKWTPYQLKIIAALKAGATLHLSSGCHAYYFLSDHSVRPSPSGSTVKNLEQGGMLACIKTDWRGAMWKWSGVEP